MNDDTAEKDSWVRRRAYQLWQESGEEHGQHDNHWHQATREYDEAMGRPPEDAGEAGDLEQDMIETPPPAGATPDSVAAATGSTPAEAAAVDAALPGKA
jgi:hypothetical protein